MKRYLVFASESYYPSCGWNDFDSDHDTLEAAEAKRKSVHTPYSISHTVDTETGQIVVRQYEGHEPDDCANTRNLPRDENATE